MKTIGFIGAFDKIDLMLNIAKILTIAKCKVLIIDSTVLQKSRYIVPVINPTKSYITTFETIDVAIGFEKLEDIKRYFALSNNETFDYEVVLVDCDSPESFKKFNLNGADINYFVTSFGAYYLKRGVEILQNIGERVVVKKVLFSRYMSEEEDEYLNFLSKDINVDWVKGKIYFPDVSADLYTNSENQLSEKINIKGLSEEYKTGMWYICEEIFKNEANQSELKKIIKTLEGR